MEEVEQLRTDYKDDMIKDSNLYRKYNMISNSDGTVSFEDVTEYDIEGDVFNANTLNGITNRINDISNEILKETLEITNLISDNATIENLTAKEGTIGIWNFSNEKGLYATYRRNFNFTSEDQTKISQYISGTTILTDEEFRKYDILQDGEITTIDYVFVRGIVNGTYNNYADYVFYINPLDPLNFIKQEIIFNGTTYTSSIMLGVLKYENFK